MRRKKSETDEPHEELQRLRARVAELETRIYFLERHDFLTQGFRGESLICELTGGVASALGKAYDVLVGDKLKLEVKFSRLRVPVKGALTRRWQWTRPLGWNNYGKDYDLLLLVGEKDPRYTQQYPDNSPYVYFLVPKTNVLDLMTVDREMDAGHITVSTNLLNMRSARGKLLHRFLVPFDRIRALSPIIDNASRNHAPNM